MQLECSNLADVNSWCEICSDNILMFQVKILTVIGVQSQTLNCSLYDIII